MNINKIIAIVYDFFLTFWRHLCELLSWKMVDLHSRNRRSRQMFSLAEKLSV